MNRVEAFKLTNPTKYNFMLERLWVEHLKCSLRAASLVGQSAPPEFLQLVTYVAFNHHQKIRRLDTVRAYMLGGHYFVEVKSLKLWAIYHLFLHVVMWTNLGPKMKLHIYIPQLITYGRFNNIVIFSADEVVVVFILLRNVIKSLAWHWYDHSKLFSN